ncbi:hypothetical protein [Polaromonas sp.]|uniref:hypothetical protein n=1 Tax=Polaromonas sp. TaxID=1869339 RepID=UPI0018119A73|nr:hypothetical protein [Polaromonas sp.]NMM05712.1 hypothetical protein [Polaromonas sp.]
MPHDFLRQAHASHSRWHGGTDVLGVHHKLPPGTTFADKKIGWRWALDKLAGLVEVGQKT